MKKILFVILIALVLCISLPTDADATCIGTKRACRLQADVAYFADEMNWWQYADELTACDLAYYYCLCGGFCGM